MPRPGCLAEENGSSILRSAVGLAAAHARQRKTQPWSVPRLRGRGEQGNIVMHT